MKKHLIILSTTFTLLACTNTSLKNELNESSLKYIDTERDVYFKDDSLTIHPFEQFNVVKFERIDNESSLSLTFNIIDTIQIIKVSPENKINTRVIDHSIYIYGNEIKYDNVSATIKLKTVNGYIDRKIEIGKEYKMIYCYLSDSEFHRLDPASDNYYDGYYIVDIVPLDERFEREKGKSISYEFNYKLKVDKQKKISLVISDKSKKVVFSIEMPEDKTGLFSFENYENEITSFVTGYNINSEHMDGDYGSLAIADFNFDNKEDFALKIGDGNAGSIYQFFIQTDEGKFIKEEYLTEELMHFPSKIDLQTNSLERSYHVGANEAYLDVFIYDKATGKFSKKTTQLY